MSQLIDEILSEMKAEHGISKFELEKIVDSQYKLLAEHIYKRDLREVHIKGLGKFKPTTFLIALEQGRVTFKNGQKSQKRFNDEYEF